MEEGEQGETKGELGRFEADNEFKRREDKDLCLLLYGGFISFNFLVSALLGLFPSLSFSASLLSEASIVTFLLGSLTAGRNINFPLIIWYLLPQFSPVL